jgi:hypothetical protein
LAAGPAGSALFQSRWKTQVISFCEEMDRPVSILLEAPPGAYPGEKVFQDPA